MHHFLSTISCVNIAVQSTFPPSASSIFQTEEERRKANSFTHQLNQQAIRRQVNMSDLDRTTTRTTKSYKKSVMLTSHLRSSSPIRDASSASGAGVGGGGPLALPSPGSSSSSLSRMKGGTTVASLFPSSSTTAGGGGGAGTFFPQTYCCILTIPFLGRAALKTVTVPKAMVETDPPTVRTAKTVLCSYKVCLMQSFFPPLIHRQL